MKLLYLLGSILFTASVIAGKEEAIFKLSTAKLKIGATAKASIAFSDGQSWPESEQPAFAVESDGETQLARSAQRTGDKLSVYFDGDTRAEFQVTTDRGFALFRLVHLETPRPVSLFRLFLLPAPIKARPSGVLNGAALDGNFAAVMALQPNVHVYNQRAGGTRVDRTGCRHEFAQVAPGKVGQHAAAFSASCDAKPLGWSMRGKNFPAPLDLSGCKSLRVWVHGDGRGEALKIQLYDGEGGYRDDYIPIDFQGWRQVILTNSALNTLHYDRVRTINFYYNGLPASTSVTCQIDHVEALLERDGTNRVLILEDFESAASPLWSSSVMNLCAETLEKHGIEPAAFGVIACREQDFAETMQRFQKAAGLPSPHPGGVWNKQSPRVKESYLFLTSFRESQFDEALTMARRGGFKTILFGQESWCESTGHYGINRKHFPDGLEGFRRTVQRFKQAGFHVGLHFLGASIYPPDTYLTPVPDARLVKGASATLAADVNATTNFLTVDALPEAFPAEDGGYTGNGTVLQVGDELIQYGKRALQPPFGFHDLHRGHLGTKPAAHKKGEPVRHLVRSFGYHMYDMDTTLLDEVSSHLAHVANTCDVDMLYFDGSERLQGDHWYYNALLHRRFYDKLVNKDMLLQASSFSHYSWHVLARSASADGHGDLKGYLDQRSGAFTSFAQDHMPLDIGWYYGYDPTTTPDMFEYVLGATIGYNSSMSFQVSCEAAARHPFTGEILDLIARYEKLRLAGRIPKSVRAKFEIDPSMTAITPGDFHSDLLQKRREYRLLEVGGDPIFQRVAYEPWNEIKGSGTNAPPWTVHVKEPARLGLQIHALRGTEIVDPWVELDGKRWSWQGKLAGGEFLIFWPGEPVKRYAPSREPERGEMAAEITVKAGVYAATFGARSFQTNGLRVRITEEFSERIPAK